LSSRLRTISLAALAATLIAFGDPGHAFAQNATSDATDPNPPAPEPEARYPVAFEADQVDYRQDEESFVASGDVVLRSETRSLRADTVSWNTKSGEIVASGNIRMVDEDGNQLF